MFWTGWKQQHVSYLVVPPTTEPLKPVNTSQEQSNNGSWSLGIAGIEEEKTKRSASVGDVGVFSHPGENTGKVKG